MLITIFAFWWVMNFLNHGLPLIKGLDGELGTGR